MKLSQRLLTISSFIKEGSVVADIGADHGLLSIYLIENKIAQKVFAVENKTGPFSILEKSTKSYPHITTSLSDGISQIPEDVDTVVIAGMGGILISDILKKNKDKLNNVKYIILDAHRDLELVRQTLLELGYKFEKEVLVKEGNYYHVMSLTKGHGEISKTDLEFGYHINNDPLFNVYQSHLLNQLERNYKSSNSKELNQKIERLKSL